MTVINTGGYRILAVIVTMLIAAGQVIVVCIPRLVISLSKMEDRMLYRNSGS